VKHSVNQSFWSGKRVLLTGHTGFKGAWLTLWLQRLGARVTGVSLAAEQPSLFRILAPWSGLDHHEHDIRDAEGLAALLRDAKPDIVLHLAAQALVRVGYADPVGTFATNLMGTVNLLDAVRRYPSAEAVLIVTTDKVYRPNAEQAHRETDPLGGLEPYAASKSCAELATTAWIASYAADGKPAIATARAGNVIGGGDWACDRLVPSAPWPPARRSRCATRTRSGPGSSCWNRCRDI
jgi:CDP-glucose 4,6-dehydratase